MVMFIVMAKAAAHHCEVEVSVSRVEVIAGAGGRAITNTWGTAAVAAALEPSVAVQSGSTTGVG